MKPLKSLDLVDGSVDGLAFSPRGSAIGVYFKQTVLILSIPDGDVMKRLTRVCGVDAIAFSDDGRRLAVACKRGRILLLDVDSGKAQQTLKHDCGGYHEVAWSRDERLLAAGEYEPFVAVFDLNASKRIRRLNPNVFDDEGRTVVRFSSGGRLLASTGYNRIFFWKTAALADPDNPKPEHVGLTEHAHFTDLAFSADESTVAALAESEGTCAIHLWRIDTRKKLGRIPLPHFSLRLAWCHRIDLLAVAEHGGDGVSFWNPWERRRSDVAVDSSDNVTTLATSQDGGVLAAGTAGGKLLLWSVESSEESR